MDQMHKQTQKMMNTKSFYEVQPRLPTSTVNLIKVSGYDLAAQVKFSMYYNNFKPLFIS